MEQQRNQGIGSEDPSKQRPRTLQFVLRTEQEAQLYGLIATTSVTDQTVAPEIARDARFQVENPEAVEFSADGRLGAVAHGKGVVVVDCTGGEGWALRHNLPEAEVAALSFSPRGSFLLTLARLPSARVGQPTPTPEKGNLCVWDTRSGQLLAHFLHKKSSVGAWPVIRWSEDEEVAAKLVSNEIQFFHRANFDHVTRRIRLEGVANFSLAPRTLPPAIAAFVPEKKGGPGQVSIFKYPALDRPVASKSLWKAQTAELEWGPNASGLLVAAKTEVDKSGRSYYGSTALHFLSPNGAVDAALALEEEGPVHEWSWSPDGSKFVVIYGYMPARATLFDVKCNKLADFGKAARNTAKWSPCSRLLALGGFGNLNGQIDIWEVASVRKVGSCQASCASSLEWSPDSAYLMAAVLSPMIRVDNGVTVFRYNGAVVTRVAADKLYQAAWRPARLEDFGAPFRIRPAKAGAPATGNNPGRAASGGSAASGAGSGAKPAIYQPPSRRGMGAGPVTALRDEDESELQPKNYTAAQTAKSGRKPAPELPVGFVVEEKSKSSKRNKQRRQQQQRKKADNENEEVIVRQKPEKPTPQPARQGTTATVQVEADSDPAKKAKALEKKLRQIAALKEKQASGATLDADQLLKLAAEADLLQQLKKLKL